MGFLWGSNQLKVEEALDLSWGIFWDEETRAVKFEFPDTSIGNVRLGSMNAIFWGHKFCAVTIYVEGRSSGERLKSILEEVYGPSDDRQCEFSATPSFPPDPFEQQNTSGDLSVRCWNSPGTTRVLRERTLHRIFEEDRWLYKFEAMSVLYADSIEYCRKLYQEEQMRARDLLKEETEQRKQQEIEEQHKRQKEESERIKKKF